MGFFSGMKGTKANTRSANIAPGHMIVRIDRVKQQTSAQDGVEYVAVEQTVLVQFTKPDSAGNGPAYPNGTKVPLNEAGQSVAHIFKGGDKQKDEMARAAFKGFLMGATGQPESSIDDADGEAACGPDNPLGGVFVEVNAVPGMTKKLPKPFTYINYLRPVSAARLLQVIDPAVKAKLFAGTALEDMAANEAK